MKGKRLRDPHLGLSQPEVSLTQWQQQNRQTPDYRHKAARQLWASTGAQVAHPGAQRPWSYHFLTSTVKLVLMSEIHSVWPPR